MIIAPSSMNQQAFEIEPNRIYSADELLLISANSFHRFELRKGKLTMMSPAGFEHGDLAMALGARMRVHAEDNQLGRVEAAETGFLLTRDPDTVHAPLTLPLCKKIVYRSGSYLEAISPGAPDLVVEVVSPGDRASEVQEKVQTWLHHGTKLVWIVEPKTETLTIYRADDSVTLLQSSDTLDGEDVLPGFRYELARLFA